MAGDGEQAIARDLQSLDTAIQRVRAEIRGLHEDLGDPAEGALAGRMAAEQEALLVELERQRDELRWRLGQHPPDLTVSARRTDQVAEPGLDELRSSEDDPATVAHEGRGEDIDPAVSSDEWTARRDDQLSEAADVDDPVEALEVGALWAGSEASPAGDATELADRAAPAAPEEAALAERAGISPEAADLIGGLPPSVDLERLDEASLEDLVEAELIAIDAGDPDIAAAVAAELERRRKRAERSGR
jgi:hypothetical protein